MSRRNIYAESDVFIDLIDHPGTFGLVLDLMGSYIGCSVGQATMRPLDQSYKGYIHPDGGEALEQIRVTETSLPLQVKIQYFLTPLPETNMGNFIVFPGSHLRPWPEERLPAGTDTPGRRAAVCRGGRCRDLPARPLARPGTESIGPNPEDPDLPLQPAVHAAVGLRRGFAGATGTVYAAPTAAFGRRGRLAPRHLLPQPQPREPGRTHGGNGRTGVVGARSIAPLLCVLCG